mmetsp:Transcript_27419/g.65930  ORF Transcript_27419/g.65930 Transcript_27419/m.65930 type:complete len:261 (-) Transcript_27419:59-841(-)
MIPSSSMTSLRHQQLFYLVLLLLSLATKGTDAFYFPRSARLKQSKSTTGGPNQIPNSSSSNSPRHRSHPLHMTEPYSCPNETVKRIYDIPDSGWKSPRWNWGSARGTGHDCAAICRRRWDTKSDRQGLVESLLSPAEFKATHPSSEISFEEVKLILGLAWQRGRWDGSDGGPGGYSQVLETLADARRYEEEDEVISAINFIEDVSGRFETISRTAEESKRMKAIANDVRGKHAGKEELFMMRRKCAGMVLDAMYFAVNGL